MTPSQAAQIRGAIKAARRNADGRRAWLRDQHRTTLEKIALNAALMNLIRNYKRQHGLP